MNQNNTRARDEMRSAGDLMVAKIATGLSRAVATAAIEWASDQEERLNEVLAEQRDAETDGAIRTVEMIEAERDRIEGELQAGNLSRAKQLVYKRRLGQLGQIEEAIVAELESELGEHHPEQLPAAPEQTQDVVMVPRKKADRRKKPANSKS